ncbi:MAG: hypothetical protein WB789_02665 [Thermoplasmata archaeon]
MSGSREPALAAPGLIGPISILNQPISGPRSNRRRKNRPFSHVHLELDLARTAGVPANAPAPGGLEEFLRGGKVVESADLLRLTGSTLHALSARGLRRVDHWEVSPGGWLPPPEVSTRPGKDETVGHLLKAIESKDGPSMAQARSFSVRLSGPGGKHVDAVVRRTHRGGRHSISLDLHGTWTREEVEGLKGAMADRLPVEHTEMTKFQYAYGK